MLAYLAGAIEYSPDLGRGWRREIAPFLRDYLGHDVYDPAEDERKSLTEEEQKNLRAWKRTEFSRFQSAVRKIIEWDLDIVARCDYIICYLDEHALKGGGTSAELTFAHRRGVPVYMVTPLSVPEISGWILGCCTCIFPDFEQLKQFLKNHRQEKQMTNDE
jgi:nucleoside 2-deoxyribosyltransferase